ncbi:MAG: flagellar protein FlaG [Pseudomonadales bacterium]|nr:flagellar protein FlaG [Pseudomonadales bacterium]
MNSINPQGTSVDVQRSETRGGQRTEAKISPAANGAGKDIASTDIASNDITSKDVSQRVKTQESDQAVASQPGVDEAQADEQREQLVVAVAQLNDYIQTVQRDLEFTLDESSGTSVISVVDRQSSEIVRQIPAEITLTLAQRLSNEEPLYLFSAQV